MAPSDAWKRSSKQSLDLLKEESNASRVKDIEDPQSRTGMCVADVKRLKRSAQDLLADLSRRRLSMSDIQFIGNGPKYCGGHANVLVATLVRKDGNAEEPKKIVAVKELRFVLNSDMTKEKVFRLFVNELLLLDKLSHPNVVEILGFVEGIEKGIAWLIFPWEDNGNLREFLRSGKWEIPERVSLIQDVALGLEYLHTRQPPICHGDLKSLNILINSSNRAVITDFGSARIVREARESRASPATQPVASASSVAATDSQQPRLSVTASNSMLTLTGPTFSLRWAPPEALNGESLSLDLARDIWALGWIAWEAVTDCYPFEELDRELQVTMKIVRGQLPLIYDHAQLSQIQHLCSIMERCWNADPKQRPSSTECRKFLKWIPSGIPAKQTGEQSKIRSAPLLLQIGEMHRLQNRFEEASNCYREGLAIAQSTGDQPTLAHLLVQMAAIHQAGSQYVKAKSCYKQALAIYWGTGNYLGLANALRGLGHVHRALSEYIQAETAYERTLTIQTRIKDDLGHASALDGLGDVQRQRSKYVEAEASYSQALAIFASIGNDLGQANALNGLGDVRRERSNYVEAEESYMQAMVIHKSIGNELGVANALDGLGDVQREQSKYDEAESSYLQALSIYESIGDDLGQGNTLLGLGDVQGQRSKYAEAESSYSQALAIYKNVGNDLGHGNALDGLGDAQREQGKFGQAEASYNQAIEIFKRIGNDLGHGNALNGLGDAQREQFKFTQAVSSHRQALEIFNRIGNHVGHANASRGLEAAQRRISKNNGARYRWFYPQASFRMGNGLDSLLDLLVALRQVSLPTSDTPLLLTIY